ncbi:hypothetical protein LY76DRAFT_346621 [Colletotrichum caudatum]|nr:hypothetical protein LY76DRAFT_346621 [Colletotrichum caudatum]
MGAESETPAPPVHPSPACLGDGRTDSECHCVVDVAVVVSSSSSSYTSRFFRIVFSCCTGYSSAAAASSCPPPLPSWMDKQHGESLDCVICVSAGVFSLRLGNRFSPRLRQDRLLTSLWPKLKSPGPSPPLVKSAPPAVETRNSRPFRWSPFFSLEP